MAETFHGIRLVRRVWPRQGRARSVQSAASWSVSCHMRRPDESHRRRFWPLHRSRPNSMPCCVARVPPSWRSKRMAKLLRCRNLAMNVPDSGGCCKPCRAWRLMEEDGATHLGSPEDHGCFQSTSMTVSPRSASNRIGRTLDLDGDRDRWTSISRQEETRMVAV